MIRKEIEEMKNKIVKGIFLCALACAVPAGVAGIGTSAEAAEAVNAEFSLQDEVPENAVFEQLSWMDTVVYSYAPSELYDPITSMMPVFYVYPDEPLQSMDEAWEKLRDSGLLKLAEAEHAAVLYLNPLNGEQYGAEDYDQWFKLCQAMSGTKNLDFEYSLPYPAVILKKLFVIGEGQGADFVANYLTNDVASGMIAGNLLIGGSSVPEESAYAIPSYLIGCSEDVVAYYQGINETDAEDTVEGKTVYYNSNYVMDSGYTPKRVIIGDQEISALDEETAEDAWNVLFKRVWNDILEYSYLTEGVEGGVVADRPVPEELDLTFNEITGEEAEGTGQSRWYEWVPNEVYKTMEEGTDETYPLIVVMHGNGDHEIYEAESNGWVQLAGDERVIVVAPKDIYELGMPPESAPTRYGKENADFIRNVICEKYPVDMSRIYIAGFSIGAFVTADTSAADPGLFAAAAPMAYPGDGFMQIWPYEDYGSDPEKYDMPLMYMCGHNDRGNTMVNPQTDSDSETGANSWTSTAPRVMATQLMFNQVLTFNEMTDQLIDLEDFDYDLYPGENDAKTDKETGEIVGGYDFWDGTAAQYITQNLDFDAYPFYGFDVEGTPNAERDVLTTPEGIEYERNRYYNEEGWNMLEFLVMGDMGHNHYNRYAQIIWNDLFSHYSRDPETGVLSYDGVSATK